MSAKVILVIVDGAGYAAAVSQCGFLEGAVEQGTARRWKMRTATRQIAKVGSNVWCNRGARPSIARPAKDDLKAGQSLIFVRPTFP